MVKSENRRGQFRRFDSNGVVPSPGFSLKKWAGPSLLLTLFLVFYVWEGIQTGKLVREVGELRVTKTKLENRVQILSVHMDRLSSFDRIEKLARSQLGMTLPEGKVPVVRVPMDKEF